MLGASSTVSGCIMVGVLALCCAARCAPQSGAPDTLLVETFDDGEAALARWEYVADGPARLAIRASDDGEGKPGYEVYVDFRERASWHLLSRGVLKLEQGAQYTLSARVRRNLGYGGFRLVAQTPGVEPEAVAEVPILKRLNERHTLTAVFRPPPGVTEVRVGIVASGYSEIGVAEISLRRNVPPLSPYRTGLLIPSTPPIRARYRTGAFLEAEDLLDADAPVTDADRDGDELWSLCAVDPDGNPWLFAENTVIKSDSLSGEEGSKLPPLRLRAKGLLPGPYQVFLSDPLRDAAISLDGVTWRRVPGGEGEVPLGLLNIDGQFAMWVGHRCTTEANPGPIYVDYLRFMPVYEAGAGLEEPAGIPAVQERAGTTEVALRLFNPGGIGRRQEWVTAGMPFSRGAFCVGDGVRIDGVRSLQATPLVLWPDGSVKWLRLRFRANLTAQLETVLPLRYGPAVAGRPPPSSPLRQTADGYTLRSGALEVRVVRGIWDRIALDGRTIVAEAPSVRFTTASGTRLAQLQVESISVEHEGGQPGLRIAGHLASNAVPGPASFTVRLCERGPDTLRASFAVVNESDEAFQPKGGCSPAVALTELSLVIRGVQVTPDSLVWPSGEVPFVGSEQTLLQAGSGRCVEDFIGEWTLSEGQRVLAHGERTEGWVDLRQAGRGLALGVREFLEKQPSALTVRGGDGGTELEVGLWPRRDGQVLRFAQGTQLVAELALVVHDGTTPANERTSRLASVLHPVRAALPAEHYCRTGVFGPLSPERGKRYEPYFQSADAFFRDLQAKYRSYGIEDWGDFFADNGYVRGSGKLWTNMEWEFPAYLIHQFASSGDAEYLRVADEAARHFAAIDVCHHSSRPEWPGGSYVHTPDLREGHQVDPPDFAHAGWTQGLLWVYYLCGDESLVEAATGLADYIVRNMPPDGPYESQPPFSMWNCSRQAGNPILTLASVWDLTRDPAQLNALNRLADFALRVQDPKLGCWSTPFYEEPVHHRPSPDYSGLLFRGLYTYWQLTGDARVQRAFNRLEDFLLGRHPQEVRRYLRSDSGYRHSLVNVGIPCALAAEFSDDPAKLLELGTAELTREFPAGRVTTPHVRIAPGVFSSGAHLIGASSRE
jgi:hypothetical protein